MECAHLSVCWYDLAMMLVSIILEVTDALIQVQCRVRHPGDLTRKCKINERLATLLDSNVWKRYYPTYPWSPEYTNRSILLIFLFHLKLNCINTTYNVCANNIDPGVVAWNPDWLVVDELLHRPTWMASVGVQRGLVGVILFTSCRISPFVFRTQTVGSYDSLTTTIIMSKERPFKNNPIGKIARSFKGKFSSLLHASQPSRSTWI